MSGICALIRTDGAAVEPRRLAAALGALRAQSSVRDGVWTGANGNITVGVACTLPEITEEDTRERQPLIAGDGEIVLVADARIDNRGELVRAVHLDAGESDAPDARLMLEAYRKWGDDCPRYLLGDFAFVLWDARRSRLLFARDHLGQRTLVYRESRGTLAIASSPEALVRLDGGPRRLDLDAVADFLMVAQEPGRAFYEGVRAVPPGRTLEFDARGLRFRTYWSLDDLASVRLRSDDAYVERFRELWGEAVDCRLRARSAAGVLLSGGLDSSAVAATAAARLRLHGGRIFAFHATAREGFQGAARKGWINDETEDVRAIAALHENIDLEIVRSDARSFLDGLESMFHHGGVPIPNVDNRTWFEGIFGRAASRGLQVMLGGFKGNATISYTGVRGLRTMAYTGRWPTLLREARSLARRRGRLARSVLKEAVMPPIPVPMRAWLRRVRGRKSESLLAALSSPISAELARERRVEQRVREWGFDPRFADRSTGLRYRVNLLRHTGDHASIYRALRAVYGIEARDPTSDIRIVEFCLGIPEQQYLRGGRERQLVRRAMEGLVPERVLQRQTRGAQSADWSERLTALRGTLAARIEEMETSHTITSCIDVPRMRELVENWPDELGIEHASEYRYGLLSGIMMAEFIRWFESTPSAAGAA